MSTAEGREREGARNELHSAWLVARRRWRWLVGSVVVVCAFAVAFSVHERKLYSASSDVYLSQQNLADDLSGIASQQAYDTPTLQREGATQASIADTSNVATRALQAVKGTGLTPSSFLDELNVSANPGADILDFTVTSRSSRNAIDLVNAAARSYIAYRVQLDTGSIALARNQIASNLGQLVASGQRGSTLYDSLVSKDEQLQSLEALETSNATVIDSAVHASLVQPRLARNIVLGVLFGLILGILFMGLREVSDTRLRSEDEIALELGLPLIGRVGPPPSGLRSLTSPAVMIADPQHRSSDAYRLLRATVELSLLKTRVLMVTSAGEAEGKSTTVANLAVAMARVGARVLVVDLDLRRPRQESLLECTARYGLTDLLRGASTVADALLAVPMERDAARSASSVHHGSLTLLAAGTAPADVSEVLASSDIGGLVKEIRTRDAIDLVIIDAPPAVLYSDATSLAAISDAVLLVARLGELRRPAARELRRLIVQWDVRRLGFVATGARDRAGYGASYGYYRDADKDRRSRQIADDSRTGANRGDEIGRHSLASRGDVT